MGFGEDAAYTAAAAGMAAAAKGLTYLTAKATLYCRIIGADGMNDMTGASINEDVAVLKSLTTGRRKRASHWARRAGAVVTQAALTTAAAETKLTEAETALGMLQAGFVPMKVQYNPASLRMNTAAGRIQKYTAVSDENPNALQNTDKKSSTYLTVQLIFEKIENSSAFGMTQLFGEGLSASGLINTGIETIGNLFTDGLSVRQQVEGLISLLMLKRTRQVIFVWNDMFFHGELISVDANFVMFDKEGKPIKATVEMQIQQTNSNATFKSDMEYWDGILDDVFK